MQTKAQLIAEIEKLAKESIGKKYKYNILNAFRGYKYWKKSNLEELKEKLF